MESYTGQVLNNQDVRVVDSLDPLGYKDINTAAAIVTVRDAVTGNPISTIYSDNLATPLSNPFNTDSEGGFTFFAKNGLYNIVINEGELTEFTVDDVSIFDQLDLPTTTDLINGTRAIKSGDIVETSGFTTSGDGGGAKWQFNGLTGQTASQTPAQLGNALLNDASGNQFKLVLTGGTIPLESLGAKGDNSTDDTTAIQAAINTSESLSVPVLVSSKVFIVTSLILKAGVSIRGTSLNSSIIKRKAATGAVLLTATSISNVSLYGFTLDGNDPNSTGATLNLIVDGCNNFSVNNIGSINSRSHSISIRNNTDEDNDTKTTVNNCNIKGGVGYGIEVLDSRRVIVDGNKINSTGNHGIFVNGTTTGATRTVSLINNTITEAANSGISVPAITVPTDAGSQEVLINGNQCIDNAENGILIQAKIADVSGNICSRNGTTISHQGIVANGEEITITGNNCSVNAGVGIDLGDANTCTVTGNTVTSNGIIGIEVNSCKDVVVSSNILKSNYSNASSGVSDELKAGIVVHKGPSFSGNAENVNIANNTVRGGADQQYAISVTAETDSVNVTNNEVASGGISKDIKIDAPTHSFTCQNNITDDAVSIASASTVTVEHNSNYQLISGTTTVTSIVTPSGTYQRGRELRILFTGALTFTDGGNLRLAGDLVTVFGTTVSLVQDNGVWYELSRSVN